MVFPFHNQVYFALPLAPEVAVAQKESVEPLAYRIGALVSLCANKQYPTPPVYIERYITKHGDECLFLLILGTVKFTRFRFGDVLKHFHQSICH